MGSRFSCIIRDKGCAMFSANHAPHKNKAIGVRCVFEGFYVSASTKHLSYMLANGWKGVGLKKKSYPYLLFGQDFNVSCSHPWEPVEILIVILNVACSFGSWFHSFWRQSNQITWIYFICQWKLFIASTVRTLLTSAFFFFFFQLNIKSKLLYTQYPFPARNNSICWSKAKHISNTARSANDFKTPKKF